MIARLERYSWDLVVTVLKLDSNLSTKQDIAVTGCDDAEILVEASVTSIRLDPLRKDRHLIAALSRSTESQNGATGIAGRVAKDIIQEIRPQSTDLITTRTRNLTKVSTYTPTLRRCYITTTST
jgi:hypothetical protein